MPTRYTSPFFPARPDPDRCKIVTFRVKTLPIDTKNSPKTCQKLYKNASKSHKIGNGGLGQCVSPGLEAILSALYLPRHIPATSPPCLALCVRYAPPCPHHAHTPSSAPHFTPAQRWRNPYTPAFFPTPPLPNPFTPQRVFIRFDRYFLHREQAWPDIPSPK